jgi:hypothetical protein
MSASTPAFSKASPRNWRSAVSQRADDAESGRMTPTFPFAAEGLALESESAESAESLPHPTSARAHALITARDLRDLVDMRWFLSAIDSSTFEERRPGRAGTAAPYVVVSNLGMPELRRKHFGRLGGRKHITMSSRFGRRCGRTAPLRLVSAGASGDVALL